MQNAFHIRSIKPQKDTSAPAVSFAELRFHSCLCMCPTFSDPVCLGHSFTHSSAEAILLDTATAAVPRMSFLYVACCCIKGHHLLAMSGQESLIARQEGLRARQEGVMSRQEGLIPRQEGLMARGLRGLTYPCGAPWPQSCACMQG